MRGTFRPDRHGDPATEPEPPKLARVPKPPEHLDDDGRRVWKDLAKQLHPLGLLSAGDLPALEAMCAAYSMALQAEAVVRDEGMTVEGPQGIKAHPCVMIARQNWALYRVYAQEFGLTPSARTRVRGPEAPAKPKASPFGEFVHPRQHGGQRGGGAS